MSEQELAKQIKDALVSFDGDKVTAFLKQGLEKGFDPVFLVNQGITPGLTEMGDLFERNEIFLPELILGGKIGLAAIDAIKPYLETKGGGGKKKGLLLLGTVKDDVHEIGKNLVRLISIINGFEVVDLGMDVASETFVDKVMELKPDILGLSALLSTTLVHQRTVIQLLEKQGCRDQVKVIVGGAPVHQAWAEQIGADGYGENAVEAVKIMLNWTK